jgi:hypothetical protein
MKDEILSGQWAVRSGQWAVDSEGRAIYCPL